MNNFFWVNVGGTIDEVLEESYLWAPFPFKKPDGKRKQNNPGWASLDKVQTGDVFFLKEKSEFKYAAVALSAMFPSERPATRNFVKWAKDGRRVNIELIKLSNVVDAKGIIPIFLEKYYDRCIPRVIGKEGRFCETYASQLPIDAGLYLLDLVGKDRDKIVELSKSVINSKVEHDEFPYFSHSWRLESKSVAVKTVDKTLKDEATTAVPLDIVNFFIGNSILKKGKKLGLKFNIQGAEYLADIARKADGRYKITLTPVKKVLRLTKLNVNDDLVWFERDNEDALLFYVFTKSKNNNISVLPKPSMTKPVMTTRTTSGSARVGQDYFKAEVSEICGNRCVVTNVANIFPSILIGSHIKPWSESNDDERMDGHNGLLLSPHVDKLFDKYLITFDKNGRIISSSRLEPQTLKVWNIDVDRLYTLTSKQHEYMKHHREKFYHLDEEAKSKLL